MAEDQNAPELPVGEAKEEPAVKPETEESDPEPEKPTKPKRKTKHKVKTCSICGGKIEVHNEEKTLECLKELPGFDELEKIDVFNMRDVLDFALKQDVVLSVSQDMGQTFIQQGEIMFTADEPALFVCHLILGM